ncbi:MAG: helix-turn-helix domain-containing protein [Streptococcus sp.]|nr:helix-turn-helix domain-containing protein [Streptococcus sp.]
MIKTSGKIFKIIRESKNMSLKEVADEDISVAQLSRFERGISGISVEAFYRCLKNMLVSIDEFQYVYHNYSEPFELAFSNSLLDAYRENNITKLAMMLDDCQKLEQGKPNKKYYKLNTIVVKSLLSYCDAEVQVSKEDIDFLTDYLFSIEEWGRYELWLFTNSVELLTVSTLEMFTNEMLNRTQFYNKLPENRKLILQMLLNVINVFVEAEQFPIAMKFLNYIENSSIPEINVYERLLFKYQKAHYSYRIGNVEALKNMKECLKIAEFLECYGIAQKIKNQIDKVETY